ncbi:MAG: hypothetical protein AAF960_25995 [Bacteroidota bacterium]
MKHLFYFLFKIVLLLSLPFICLVRGAVYLYEQQQFGSWTAIFGAAGITTFLLIIYLLFFYGKITGKIGNLKNKLVLALILVIGYGVHGLYFFSNKNAKQTSVQREFTSLHPILRLSISTIIHLDQGLIMTDANRLPEDYRKMGLKSRKNSLHYKQKNGYVHAFDVRTKGRSWLRNSLLQLYFKSMGFNTLRHGGTGDHLHVSLTSRDRPWAI